MERFNASDPPKYHPRDLQMGIGFRLKNAHPSRGNILAKRIPGSNSFEKNLTLSNTILYTLQGTNISPKNGILKMIFLFPRWDMLIPWRVFVYHLVALQS